MGRLGTDGAHDFSPVERSSALSGPSLPLEPKGPPTALKIGLTTMDDKLKQYPRPPEPPLVTKSTVVFIGCCLLAFAAGTLLGAVLVRISDLSVQ